MLPAVLTDFDDTAAVQNVAEMLLSQFGAPDWQAVRARFRAGQLSLTDYQEITFNHIRADRETLCAYVRENAYLRPHFGALHSLAQEYNFPLAVVSLGLDFYIHALLEKEGFPQVPIYCVNTRFAPDGGIRYYYPHSRPAAEPGSSKALIVQRYQQLGYQVLYAGDGRSDLEAAAVADTVFAHSYLAQECENRSIPYQPFHDFGDILPAVRELLDVSC